MMLQGGIEVTIGYGLVQGIHREVILRTFVLQDIYPLKYPGKWVVDDRQGVLFGDHRIDTQLFGIQGDFTLECQDMVIVLKDEFQGAKKALMPIDAWGRIGDHSGSLGVSGSVSLERKLLARGLEPL
jgi:hypothetical protein